LGRDGAPCERRRVPQLPRVGRGEGGARPCRLRRELRPAGRAQGQVRPGEPLPDEPEHHARGLALSGSPRPGTRAARAPGGSTLIGTLSVVTARTLLKE